MTRPSDRFSQLHDSLTHAAPIRDARHPEPTEGMRRAAVLILLTDDDDPAILFTERASHLRKHAGQISFPGGSRDGDETPEQTAIREAVEEVSAEPAALSVIGRLPASSLPVTSFAVTPVVAILDNPSDAMEQFEADESEVADIHWIRVSELVAESNRGTWSFGSEHSGPAFVCGEVVIWGFTAMLVDGLLELAGWSQPWNADKHVEIPLRFLGC